MPKRHYKAPTRFQSDDEDDPGVEQSSSSPKAASISDSDDIPPAPKQQPGRLSRVYTLEDDDNDKAVNVDPPKYASRSSLSVPLGKIVEPKTANIADLVAILTTSNASMKGRVDDTGRFELKFEVNREHKHGNKSRTSYDRTPSPVLWTNETESPKGSTPRGRAGKLIGWKR